MKRITIITTCCFPYGGPAETLVRNLSIGISANECNVNVVRFRGKRYTKKNDVDIEDSNYLFNKPFDSELGKILELMLNILYIPIFLLYLKFFKNKQAIILYGFEYTYQIIPFIMFSKILKIKCIRFITDHYRTTSIVPVWWKYPKFISYMIQKKYVDKFLDGVVVLSSLLYKQCQARGVKKGKIILIPHFIEILKHTVKRKTYNNNVNVCFCGTVVEANGISDLIEAMNIVQKKYQNVTLKIIGRVDKQYKNKLVTLSKKEIHFTGYLHKKEVEEELENSDILINPRKYSLAAEAGFPTKLGEYFSSKKAVVSTKLGDLKDYFIDGKELVFAEPDKPVSLAEGIMKLIEDENLRTYIGQNGYNWAIKNLNNITNSKKLLDFIDKL